MHLSPTAFDNFLGGNGVIGQDYIWYKSYPCPNVNPHSGAHDPSCEVCGGKEHIYDDGKPGVAALAGSKSQRSWVDFGEYEQGDVVVTVPEDTAMYDISQFDRVTALNETNRFSLSRVRGGTGARERLTYTVKKVTRVFWIAADGTAIVDGAIPTIGPDGVPVWDDPTQAPPDGVQYTITGERLIDYFCFGPYPQNRRMNQGSRLPIKVVLRDWDLFNR